MSAPTGEYKSVTGRECIATEQEEQPLVEKHGRRPGKAEAQSLLCPDYFTLPGRPYRRV